MKRQWKFFLPFLLIVIFLCGCTVGNNPQHLLDQGSSLDSLSDSPSLSIPFSAVYCRGNRLKDELPFGGLQVIGSMAEMDTYRQAYWPNTSYEQVLENGKTISAELDSYDTAFFAEHLLVIALVEEGSGTIRHEVVSCATASTGNEITIRSFYPTPDGSGTTDMAYWHIPIALKRADLKSLDFSLNLIPASR